MAFYILVFVAIFFRLFMTTPQMITLNHSFDMFRVNVDETGVVQVHLNSIHDLLSSQICNCLFVAEIFSQQCVKLANLNKTQRGPNHMQYMQVVS
jgi:hypothetical protein